jgi:hypothetical protein
MRTANEPSLTGSMSIVYILKPQISATQGYYNDGKALLPAKKAKKGPKIGVSQADVQIRNC